MTPDYLHMTSAELVQEVHRMTEDLRDRPALHVVLGILLARVRDPAERDRHLRQVAQDIRREFGFDKP